MESKHTPGPWGLFQSETLYVAYVGKDNQCHQQLLSFEEAETNEETTLANARLITVAPKMLQALEEACKELISSDIITKILREEKGLPHTPCKTLTLVEETLKEVYGIS